MDFDYDYLIVGSGFGGSVAALRLAEKGYRVAVMEEGRRWRASDFPRTNWQLHRWFWLPALRLRGFFTMRFFRHMVVLRGKAVGGGSITYANTLLEPLASVWSQGTWAGLEQWSEALRPHYATARRMLGVVTNPLLAAADLRLQQMAIRAGVGDSFYPTQVGVYFGTGQPDETQPSDPFFGGKGPDRSPCTGCGGCMVGCRHGAKNTLDQNYLWFAEELGAKVFAETRVEDVRPLDGKADGAAGFLVTARSLAPGSGGAIKQLRSRAVVFAASSLGTQDLLFRLRANGSLPRISAALGKGVRTNAESLIGIRFPGSKEDLSRGIAIGSGIYLDSCTNVEATRYPAGSDAMALLTALLARSGSGWRRWLLCLSALLRLLVTRPWTALRILSPFGFARQTMILLCMQTLEGQLTMRYRRRPWWPFSRGLSTHGEKIPTYIPLANRFAEQAAREFGGVAMTSLPEILFDVPMTAHCIGGAVMGATPGEGVCDHQGRVFHYRNLLICDGSILAANLGVNPALTITALAEYIMRHIPDAAWQSEEGREEVQPA